MITQCRQVLPSIDNTAANAESKSAVIFKDGVDECGIGGRFAVLRCKFDGSFPEAPSVVPAPFYDVYLLTLILATSAQKSVLLA